MSEKNFINFHVLISHSPSCLNRDDMNMQKTAVFGGMNRVRVSSQSLKYAMRKPKKATDYNYWKQVLGEPATRTRSLSKIKEEFIQQLQAEYPPDLIAEVIDRFVKDAPSTDEENDAEQETEISESRGDKKQAVAPWALAEIKELCRIVHGVKSADLTTEELETVREKVKTQKSKKKKSEQQLIDEAVNRKIEKAIEDNKVAIVTAWSSAADIALFGRMATSGLMTNVDGSLAVAHAITTHAVEPPDVDWFTAVDDLTQDAGETGAGHLNTQQFSSGVFYRYASLNIAQLQENLGGADRKRTLEIAKHVFHMLATVVPTAKQQSFAAHNPADFAIVNFADQPISLANAFEAPVMRDRHGGFLAPSIKNLAGYWVRVNNAYSLGENAAAFATALGELPDGMKPFERLADIEKWIEQDGPEKIKE